MTPLLFAGGTGGFTDLTGDEEPSRGNTLTYKLNLSQCLAAHGVSFNAGEERPLFFIAAPGGPDFGQQNVAFKRPLAELKLVDYALIESDKSNRPGSG